MLVLHVIVNSSSTEGIIVFWLFSHCSVVEGLNFSVSQTITGSICPSSTLTNHCSLKTSLTPFSPLLLLRYYVVVVGCWLITFITLYRRTIFVPPLRPVGALLLLLFPMLFSLSHDNSHSMQDDDRQSLPIIKVTPYSSLKSFGFQSIRERR